jgi:ectoine hydroxylase-related dioxygenase (phytanoyl-CoA dioxygenase family)
VTTELILDVRGLSDAVAQFGWAVTPPAIGAATLAALRNELAGVAPEGSGGARNLLERPRIRALAASLSMRRVASAVLGPSCYAVRAIYFDKTPAANWKVIWHQDLTIATRERAEVEGYGPWTVKEGVPHVQPPASVLEGMLAVRLHLDPCGADNGPVRVLDGSHRLGRLSAERIEDLRRTASARDCLVDQGGVLAFRPLIVHSSGPATVASHRRVIHIEYASEQLPPPLEWHRRVA